MLDRDQVLHVARLARLELGEEEVARMAEELSNVLDHIEKIRELDLKGVAPTSHVIDVVNALRPDDPTPSLPREVILAAAPEPLHDGFGVPIPRRGVSELIDLTAAQAAERIRAGEISAAEVFEAYRERAAADELNAFTWVAEAAPETNGHAGKPLGGVPVAVKDLFCTEGVPSQSGSKILEGYRPPYTATVVRTPRGRRPAARQDQPGRVRDGLLERELGLRAGTQSVGPHPGSRGLLGRERRGGGGRSCTVGARHRHRRLDSPTGRAVRDRRAEADLRSRATG